MGSRYGVTGYEDDPIWTRAPNELRGYEPPHTAHPVATAGAMVPYQANYSPPSNSPHHTTIVHSAIKPVPDADIYKYVE